MHPLSTETPVCSMQRCTRPYPRTTTLLAKFEAQVARRRGFPKSDRCSRARAGNTNRGRSAGAFGVSPTLNAFANAGVAIGSALRAIEILDAFDAFRRGFVANGRGAVARGVAQCAAVAALFDGVARGGVMAVLSALGASCERRRDGENSRSESMSHVVCPPRTQKLPVSARPE